VTVAIPHHGRLIPERTLESLYKQSLSPIEVIVASDTDVDRYSPPAIWPPLRRLDVANNVSIKRNVCAAEAKGDLVAFTDPDCVPDVDWLENATLPFQDSAVVGVEGLIYSDAVRGNFAPRFQPGTYMTANMVYRKSLFQKIQFDPILGEPPPHGEDTDFGYQAAYYGKVVTVKEARVYHQPKHMSMGRLVGQYILTRSKHVPLFKKWGAEFPKVVANEEKQHPLYLLALLYGSVRFRSLPPLRYCFLRWSLKNVHGLKV
jgi:glycosyltransferase involved in cell wall biosynthesis